MPLTVLVRPAAAHLPQYLEALRRGWSPDNLRPAETAAAERAAIAADAAAFLASLDNTEGRGGPITLPDGSQVARLPGFRRWIWDDEEDAFCGSIGFRWRPGTAALPAHVPGHIGYAIVPWQRGQGHARRALGLLLDAVRGLPGLTRVTLTTDPDNAASIAVIAAQGGVPVARFAKPDSLGGGEALRFRIDLALPSAA